MATATSRRRRTIALSAVAAVTAGAVIALLAGAAAPRGGTAAAAPPSTAPLSFAWLRPADPPHGWAHVSTPSGAATLFYPPTWTTQPGDPGTVSVALRDAAGAYHAYLNVTPRQGDEHLSSWPAFRLGRNRDEGDTQVHALASAGGLRFRDAVGSCVIDDYRSRVGSHPYRELACLVTGRRFTDVFIGATLQGGWSRLGVDIERAATSFTQR
jgi:hypothetical protein